MWNELLFFVTIVESFGMALLAYKFFGKTGIYVWIGIATVITNLEVAKCVDMFGLSLTLGNVMYGSVFLCTDILSEMYGGKEARKGVAVGFVAMMAFVIMSQTALEFIPNSEDFISESMEQLFGLMPRFFIASVIAFVCSNTIDTFSYEFLKKKFPDKLWLRNNLSTMTSQLLDTVMYSALAFAGLYSIELIVEISITSYIIKILIALLDTPAIYIAKRFKVKE